MRYMIMPMCAFAVAVLVPCVRADIPDHGDYVIDVAAGETLEMETITIANRDVRLVKTGAGKLILGNGNTFGDTVIVSNGYLEADWSASGLSGTHLVMCGAINVSPGMFMPRGSTFSAPVAASGAGTVEFVGYGGIKPANADLTVNLGGDGRALVNGSDGFCPVEFDLGWSTDYSLTFENTIVLNANNITIKNSLVADVKPVFFKGVLRSMASNASVSTLQYYDGPIVFVGKDNRTDIDSCKGWRFFDGAQTFSNCTLRTSSDFDIGCGTFRPAVMTLVNCDRRSTGGGWDFVSGAYGTALVVDGGVFYSHNRFGVGYPRVGYGRLTVTNEAHIIASTFSQDNGIVDMYSGLFSITNEIEPMKNKIGGGMGSVAERGEKDAGADDAVFNLHGGDIFISNGSGDLSIGYTHKGTINQTGGSLSMNSFLRLGEYAGGDGCYNLHGGTFTHRGAADHQSAIVGGAGNGVISVAHGGMFDGKGPLGVRLAVNLGSTGTVHVSPEGTMSATRFYGGSGTSTVVFNGGTIRPASNAYLGNVFQGSLSALAVTAYGGAFDTAGLGNAGHAMTMTAASTAAQLAEAPVHRWTFDNGSLKDYIGGKVASVVGSVAWTGSAIRLLGGTNGFSQVCLGTDLLPTDGRGASLECWFTKRSDSLWARIFECGNTTTAAKTNFFVSACSGNGTTPWRFRVRNFLEKDGVTVLEIGRTYHVAVVFDPQPDSTWICSAYLSDPTDGTLIEKISGVSPKGWNLKDVCQEDGLWLGHSSYEADNDPDGEYHDFRIHHHAMTERDIAWSARTGAEKVFAFRKLGIHRFWLYGANTYPCATSVEAGELKLAAGATLPPTDLMISSGALLTLDSGTAQTVKSLSGSGTVANSSIAVTNAFDSLPGLICPGGDGAVGTLTLSGTSLTAGTLKVDVGVNGMCDKLVSTGAIDLSKLSLAISDISVDDGNKYTIIEAPSVTGAFASGATARRWRVSVSSSSVTLSLAGVSIIIR